MSKTEQWRHLLDNVPKNYPEDKPVVMVNLLRFHDQAKYPTGSPHAPCSGQEAWIVRYAQEYNRIAGPHGGLESTYLGVKGTKVVGEDNEHWDAVALVKYPSIKTFRDAIGSDEYFATASIHRDAALADWKLIATTQVDITDFF
ncbi:hypothetical protein C7974DRAFT_412747 [Boeremia exigua]|uniref:uncharacterized protein n=1 Tax=Boeremia exigua TaxID=749465 RepID=UPI001E8E206D|nr:uncharacterized protein C7974DRAFT_412747 [Boeremia exigua]KAH6633777.1 hypothetical protein C7974DRAFT_412747 [Boeremia exigua]